MKTIERNTHLTETHDLVVAIRDLATSLTGDPIVGDRTMRRALRDLRNLRKEVQEEGLRGEQAREWLIESVVSLCLARSGCLRSSENAYEEESDDADADDDDDVDDGALQQDAEPEDETVVGTEAA